MMGLVQELAEKKPGKMTLIALAISVAYRYSRLVVFGLPGEVFLWELATLVRGWGSTLLVVLGRPVHVRLLLSFV